MTLNNDIQDLLVIILIFGLVGVAILTYRLTPSQELRLAREETKQLETKIELAKINETTVRVTRDKIKQQRGLVESEKLSPEQIMERLRINNVRRACRDENDFKERKCLLDNL